MFKRPKQIGVAFKMILDKNKIELLASAEKGEENSRGDCYLLVSRPTD